MARGKCDRKGRCMTERLLLYMERKDGLTRRDMERYIWRMQGQPRGSFRYYQVSWTIFGPIKRLRYRETWGTNLSSLSNLDWIVKCPDGKWRLAPGAVVKLPIYCRKPSEPPPPRSPPYRPEDHYVEQSQLWNEMFEYT